MTPDTNNFNPQELCSRKLMELISAGNSNAENKAQLQAAIAELEERRGHLAKLQHTTMGSDQT
ncbi:MAG: hypothetical protein V7709_15110 [Halioglobus sp.]